MTDAVPPSALDQILIRDLQFRCVIGVDRDERRAKQDVLAQIALYADLRKAGRTDAIEDTVDYRAIKNEILEVGEGSRFYLIEALAQRIADICLAHKAVVCVEVVVEKPGALRFARTAAVRIVRSRNAANA
jgi:D-erythro-7,8-dihydroneopterin triphosphate epimerase